MTLSIYIYIYIYIYIEREREFIRKFTLLLNVNSMTWYCHTLKTGNITNILMGH